MKYLKYDKYKETGLDWLPKIPEEWVMIPVKFINEVQNNKIQPKDLKEIDVFHYSIPNIQQYSKAKLEKGNSIDSDKLIVKENYVLVSKLNPHKQTIALVEKHSELSVASTEFVPLMLSEINPRFVSYYFQSRNVLFKLLREVSSATRSHSRVNPSEIYKTLIPKLNIPNIHLICRYLDQETSRLDELVKEKTKFIELLKEQREVLISRAVTKGLNPEVKMKNSGIDYIGEIPEHWEVRRMKYVSYINPTQKNYVFSRNLYDQVTFIPMESVSSGGDVVYSNTIKLSKALNGYTYFEKDDVILAKITPCFENGKGAILSKMKTDYAFGSTEFNVFRANESILSEYLYFLTANSHFRHIGENNMKGSAGQKRISTEFCANFKYGIPPLTEQQEIIDYLEQKLNLSKEIELEIEKSIILLKEKREAIITATVTGKIKITEEMINEGQES